MDKLNLIKQNKLINKLYELSLQNHVSVLRPETLSLLLSKIQEHNYKTCLEIGSGVGYSSSILNLIMDIDVLTIEKNKERFDLIKANTSDLKNYTCLNMDCFLFETDKKFDLIILDGPKAKQIQLIEKFINNLNDNGMIFIDNVFLNCFKNKPNLTNNQKKILNEIKLLENYLINYQKGKCKIYNIEDGVAIIYK